MNTDLPLVQVEVEFEFPESESTTFSRINLTKEFTKYFSAK